MNSTAYKLRSFAKGRYTAYKMKNKLTTEKSTAISKILGKCDYFRDAKGCGWVKSIKNEVLLILPKSPDKFQKKKA